jgi:hypothetical protein
LTVSLALIRGLQKAKGRRFSGTAANPAQWMKMKEISDELKRSRLAWEMELADLDGVLCWRPLQALGENRGANNELLRRQSNDRK